jgi:signal transduction histidine kinase
LLFLTTITANSQEKVDYYKNIIDTTSNKKAKLNALDSLFNFYRDTDQRKAVLYGEQYIDLAFEIEEYEKGIDRSITIFNPINSIFGEPDRALKVMSKSEKYLNKTDDTYLIGGVYLKKGGGYFNRGNYKKAIESHSLAIKKYGLKDSIYKADAIYFRGQAYFETGEFLKCINDYKLASQYYENLGDKAYVFYTMGAIISVYGINGFTEKAIVEREKLIEKKIKANFTNGLAVDYYNQYSSYRKTNNIKKQEEYLLKAYELGEKGRTFLDVVVIYSTLSKFYSDTDLKKSKKFLDKAYKVFENSKDKSSFFQEYQAAKANYLFKSGDNNNALTLYLSCLQEAEKNNDSSHIINYNKSLSEIYAAKGEHKNALKYYQSHTKLKDSIFNRTKTNALAYYQTLYETEKKESEIIKQKSDIEVLAAENEIKKQWMFFGGIGLGLIFLLILLYRNRMYLKRKNQLQIHFAQSLLVSQDQERKRISNDLHDSLGQSLLLVKNTISNENKNAKGLLNDAIDEMRTISRTLHPFQLKEVGITSAINNLIDQLDKNYPDTYIFGDVDDIDGVLTMEQELNLFRIVQECFSNIIKHAKAQSAKIHLEKKESEIVMILQDNGVGFDFSKKFKNLKSLGLKTIKERVRFLNGILWVESDDKGGSKFKIVIQTS